MGLKKHGGGVLTTECHSSYIKLSQSLFSSQLTLREYFVADIFSHWDLSDSAFFSMIVLLNSIYTNMRCVI